MVSTLRLSIAGTALFSLFCAAGCSSHRQPDELATAIAIGERPVAMSGDSTFFGGKLHVVATVSRGIGRGAGRNGPDGAPDSPGGVSSSIPSGKSGGGGKPDVTPDVTGMENDEAVAYMRAKYAVGSPMPPVTLRLKIENLSGAPVNIEILDFDSDLGNFAVHPGELAVAPAQIAEPDPMISQMGVTSDTIPVKITLKVGGVKESQTVLVKARVVAPPPPAPPAPPAP
jgi:hypothetical protein